MTGFGGNSKLHIGDPDAGGVYVGLSATTGKPLHAAFTDAGCLTLDEAYAAAAEMRKLPGRESAHVPTLAELSKNLFDNKDKGKLSGTFNTSGEYPASYYRSSTMYKPNTWGLGFCPSVDGFSDRDQCFIGLYDRAPVRLVW